MPRIREGRHIFMGRKACCQMFPSNVSLLSQVKCFTKSRLTQKVQHIPLFHHFLKDPNGCASTTRSERMMYLHNQACSEQTCAQYPSLRSLECKSIHCPCAGVTSTCGTGNDGYLNGVGFVSSLQGPFPKAIVYTQFWLIAFANKLMLLLCLIVVLVQVLAREMDLP